MTKKEIALKAVEALKSKYKKIKCGLEYNDPLQLLIATRLSAQCTDKRVNMVTPALFSKFRNVDDFANAKVSEVEKYIKSCGLYKTKAKDIVALSKQLVDEYDGEVPDTIEELIKLPGVGRKTANLVVGDIFKKPGCVVVDTHCIRITRRLGLHNETDQKKIELILRKLLPENESNDFCHRIVMHGRETCTARKAMCEECCMNEFCRKRK